MIDERHFSNVLDSVVQTSDHFLVAAKERMHWTSKSCHHSRRLCHSPLNSQASSVNPNLLPMILVDISHFLRASAEAVVDFERPPKRNQWHDEDCRAASSAKSAATRVIVVDYKQRRREEKRLIRRKKRERKRRLREEIEMYRSRNDAQKFFKNGV